MAIIQHNARLNAVLVDLGRSLLQYVGESCPWVGRQLASERALREVVAKQQADAGRIVELLQARDFDIDFGMYPALYTDLHFVGLSYLVKQLIASQTALVAEVDEAAHITADDPTAASLLTEITQSQREILLQLQNLKPVPEAIVTAR